jgi:hypothetical protein
MEDLWRRGEGVVAAFSHENKAEISFILSTMSMKNRDERF